MVQNDTHSVKALKVAVATSVNAGARAYRNTHSSAALDAPQWQRRCHTGGLIYKSAWGQQAATSIPSVLRHAIHTLI